MFELGKTYELVDKEGYFRCHISNESLYKSYLKEDIFTVEGDWEVNYLGALYCHDACIAGKDEFKYFKEVEGTSIPEFPKWI